MSIDSLLHYEGPYARGDACLSIKLPSKNNEPDFDFMEKYIKSLPYSSSL